MKKLKFNYLFIVTIGLFLLIVYWSVYPWLHQRGASRVAGIVARGELRVSMLSSPLTISETRGKKNGLDYELVQQFAQYLGVRLHVTVRQNINQLFDDLDSGRADLLASGLVADQRRSQRYRAGPLYYSVSQQLVYRIGSTRPHSLATLTASTLTIAPGQSIVDDLRALKRKQYPALSWQVDAQHNSHQLLDRVAAGKLAYTIADSAVVNLFQRVHPQLAVAMDITDEQPVSWFSVKDDDDSLAAALLDFFQRSHQDGLLSRLEEKYFGHGDDFDYVDTRRFLQAVDTVLPSLQPLFEKYAVHIDWRLLAAIAYQESHWNPLATSPTGVRGIMMLTKGTAQSLGITDRLDAEQSIRGGARYLYYLMSKVPAGVPQSERIWFALAAYNMGYAHMMDARTLTALQKANPDSWADVKQRLPLLNQKEWYSKTPYGYAPGRQAYTFVENIRKYQISLVGYLQEKQRQEEKQQEQLQFAKHQRERQVTPPLALPAAISASTPAPAITAPSLFPLTPFGFDVVHGKSQTVVPNKLAQEPRQ